jgi:hypothetical protein
MNVTPTIADNQTRYRTEDLQAVIDFCVQHAPYQGYGTIPAKFSFFEYKPKRVPRSFRLPLFATDAKEYGPRYVRLETAYTRTERKQPGVVWIAAPECWLDQLAQLVMSSTGQAAQLPQDGVEMLAASIKSTWHYANVPAELTLSVNVSVSPQKLKRASQTKVIKVNNYVTECSRFLDAARTAAQIVSLLPEQGQKLAAMARELQLQDPLAAMDLVDACRTAGVSLVTAELMVRSSLDKLNNNSGGST